MGRFRLSFAKSKPIETQATADAALLARHLARNFPKKRRPAPENISLEEAQLGDPRTRYFNEEINKITQQTEKTIDVETLETLLIQLDGIRERMVDQTWEALIKDIEFVSQKCQKEIDKLRQKITTLKKIRILK